jgi:hypothetical protein
MARRPMRHADRDPVASQEERLRGLLLQAQRHAYFLALSYDFGGQPDRAYAFLALGERLREAHADVGSLTRPAEPNGVAAAHSLRARAVHLRWILRGTGRDCPDVVPIVPR